MILPFSFLLVTASENNPQNILIPLDFPLLDVNMKMGKLRGRLLMRGTTLSCASSNVFHRLMEACLHQHRDV